MSIPSVSFAKRKGSVAVDMDDHIVDESYVYREDKNIYRNIYSDTSVRCCGFVNLIKKWKGSVLKLIWHELLLFVSLYAALSCVYRFALVNDPVAKQWFEIVCIYASRFRSLIPITFLTGFYVSQVVQRYWDQFFHLPYPDRVAFKIGSFIPGQDDYRRSLRRTAMRYINLSIILTFRLISPRVQRRFPDLESLEKSNLLLPDEVDRMRAIELRTPHETTWAPLLWAQSLIQYARTQKRIEIEAPVFASLITSFDYIENCNRKLLSYGWVNFPLAYTQVANISVFSYFGVSLFASQNLMPDEANRDDTFPALNVSMANSDPFRNHTPDLFVPLFTIIEFISYMGWIKVAEELLNPFGSDDEDLDINYLLDRNFQVSYMIVDEADMRFEVPQDPFLSKGISAPWELPYADEKEKKTSNLKTPAAVKKIATAFTPHARHRSFKRLRTVHRTSSTPSSPVPTSHQWSIHSIEEEATTPTVVEIPPSWMEQVRKVGRTRKNTT